MPDLPADPPASPGATAQSDVELLIDAALAHLDHLKPRSYELRHKVAKRSLDAAMLKEAAERRDLDVLQLSTQAQIIRHGSLAVGFHQNMSSPLSALDRMATNDKLLTKRILAEAGLPVARGGVAGDVAGALDSFHRLGPPVVVKPIHGSGGKGVTVDIRDEGELKAAAEDAFTGAGRVLIEEMVAGIDLRVMTVAGRAVAAMLRVPANVVGDGTATIRELIAAKNETRSANAYLRHCPIQITSFTEHHLRLRGMTPDSVPEAGRRVYLHYKANLSSGGDSYELIDVVHPDILRLAERAAACISSAYHAGVDIMVERFDAPPDGQRCIVCEINLNNEMPIHIFPMYGTPVQTGDETIEGYFFRAAGQLRADPHAIDLTPWRPADAGTPPALDDLAATAVAAPYDALTGDEPNREQTPRRLDHARLREALRASGFDEVKFRNRLIYAVQGDREVVFERAGRTVFAQAVSANPRAFRDLLRATGLPALARGRYARRNLAAAQKLAGTASGPWRLVPVAPGSRSGDLAHSRTAETAADLPAAWAQLPENASRVIVEQVPAGAVCDVLMVGGRPIATVVLSPPTVTGDGSATLGELIEAKLAARAAHPYLRHYPVDPDLISDDGLARRGLRRNHVPEAGESARLADSPLMTLGADTVGVPGCPHPELADMAAALLRSLGDAAVAGVTFAARPDDAGRTTWAVWAFDPDPELARYAFPWAGQTGPVYASVAAELAAGQRYVLPRRGRD